MYKGNRTRPCPHCGKMIQSLGWARHRATHHQRAVEAQQKSLEGQKPPTNTHMDEISLLQKLRLDIEWAALPYGESWIKRIDAVLALLRHV